MSVTKQPEVWLRGPIENIPALLQPAAHALLQAREEINEMLQQLPENLLWQKPAEVASVAFHLQHIAGVLDRLCTYAKGEQLSQLQLDSLAVEGKENKNIHLQDLLRVLNKQVDITIEQLKHTHASTLTSERFVGRKQLPSTVLGLLFHAAEHTMRHTGQLLVTVKILQS